MALLIKETKGLEEKKIDRLSVLIEQLQAHYLIYWDTGIEEYRIALEWYFNSWENEAWL